MAGARDLFTMFDWRALEEKGLISQPFVKDDVKQV